MKKETSMYERPCIVRSNITIILKHTSSKSMFKMRIMMEIERDGEIIKIFLSSLVEKLKIREEDNEKLTLISYFPPSS